MMGKGTVLDISYFPGASKALVFKQLYLRAPNLSVFFFFFFFS